MQYTALFLLILALALFWLSRQQRRRAGLPLGRVVYSDTSNWKTPERALFHPVYKLSGKPDYLIKQANTIIPVEVKSGNPPTNPYGSHIYQLAAYCLLVENEFGVRPPHGILLYREKSFRVEYTDALEHDLLNILHEMRQSDKAADLARSHEIPARCRGCGFVYTCEQRL